MFMYLKIMLISIVALFISAQVHAGILGFSNPNITLQYPDNTNSTDNITKKKDNTLNWITKKKNKKGFNNTWCFQKPDKYSTYPPGSIKKFNGIGYNSWGWN